MTDSTHEGLLPRPVQEEGQEKTAATFEKLKDFLQNNPELFTLLQTQGRENAKSSRLQPVASALAAVACGGISWARFLLVFLLTAFHTIVNTKLEIPKDSRTQLDKMNRELGEVKRKVEKVFHDVEKMEEKIQTAAEMYYRISRNDDIELEMGLINSTCVLGKCQDAMTYLKAEISDLQRGAEESVVLHIKQMTFIAGLIFAAALTAEYKFHIFSSDLRICVVIVTVILIICTWNARSYLNNKLLLTKSEEFRENDLQKVEQLHQELQRDVEYKLPSLKKQLAVLDIKVSLYASLRPHAE